VKRELRRVGAPPREAATPRIQYLVPRHLWPAAWDALTESRSAFVTGLGQDSPSAEHAPASPVEVFVAARGFAILERLGARLVGAGGSPDAWARQFQHLARMKLDAGPETQP
jgi:hypothetical protein